MTTLPQDLAQKFNDQVTAEIEASMIYLQLSYELENKGLTGMAAWMRAHSTEEMEHAERFSTHLLNRDVVPQINTVSVPEMKVVQPIDAFKLALEHEKKVSEMIRDLVRAADEVSDFDSRPMLNWFLDEQIEEEATVAEIIDRLAVAGEDGAGILRIDAELNSED
ncbi:putative ferritin-1 [Corynebacterium ciconiae DSM 44920]|uniref:ferritin n=1 Tax=Corynebacterium ciconiae TaxID=227319 RepID=UPI000373D878|nr:ferritin [Corynebacterium ciconiae]WKD60525.1 putative ferritin-1 [Corynebacterium ciconiae DSM 44920]